MASINFSPTQFTSNVQQKAKDIAKENGNDVIDTKPEKQKLVEEISNQLLPENRFVGNNEDESALDEYLRAYSNIVDFNANPQPAENEAIAIPESGTNNGPTIANGASETEEVAAVPGADEIEKNSTTVEIYAKYRITGTSEIKMQLFDPDTGKEVPMPDADTPEYLTLKAIEDQYKLMYPAEIAHEAVEGVIIKGENLFLAMEAVQGTNGLYVDNVQLAVNIGKAILIGLADRADPFSENPNQNKIEGYVALKYGNENISVQVTGYYSPRVVKETPANILETSDQNLLKNGNIIGGHAVGGEVTVKVKVGQNKDIELNFTIGGEGRLDYITNVTSDGNKTTENGMAWMLGTGMSVPNLFVPNLDLNFGANGFANNLGDNWTLGGGVGLEFLYKLPNEKIQFSLPINIGGSFNPNNNSSTGIFSVGAEVKGFFGAKKWFQPYVSGSFLFFTNKIEAPLIGLDMRYQLYKYSRFLEFSRFNYRIDFGFTVQDPAKNFFRPIAKALKLDKIIEGIKNLFNNEYAQTPDRPR